MNTFNLGVVYGNGETVSIIVCSSEDVIDRELVNQTAAKYLRLGMETKRNMREVLGLIIEGVKRYCGVNAVLVNADVSCVIPKN